MALTRLKRSRASFIACFMTGVAVASGSEKAITVCELMGKLELGTKMMVRVRGSFEATSESIALIDSTCSKPFVTDSYRWPSGIALKSADSIKEEKVPYKTRDSFVKAVQRSELAGKRMRRLMATVSGIVITREKYDVVRHKGRPIGGNGYGHLSYFPAQLIVHEVSDIEELDW